MNKLLLLLIITTFRIYSQEFNIPEIKFQSKNDTLNYVKLLDLKDSNALIIKAGYTNYWYGGTNSDFLIYNNDGSIEKYKAFFSFKGERKIKKIKVPKRKYKHYWKFIKDYAIDSLVAIDTRKLNIQKWTDEKGVIQTRSIDDGTNIKFEILRDNNYSKFESYSAEYFIAEKVPGFEERKKFVLLVNKFEEIFDK
ncbi:hypothetical protein [Flavobacterium rhizosphaerae]|uniref:Uncharacterized protein n=1 Tax=Flavobacterium rhizosphaerae TaxID=3163298 RepID=A0ABW8YVV2_9FLAO